MSDGTIAQGRPPQAGPWPAVLLSAVVAAVCAFIYWREDGSLDAVRLIDRMTIRTAAVLFSLAFVAGDLTSFFPGGATRRLMSNRRNLTVSFVIAFALHLSAVIRFYVLDPGRFLTVSPIGLIVLRGVGVLFILLILVQSLTGMRPGAWRFLPAFGAYYVLGAFLTGFAKRIPQDSFYILPSAMLIFALVIRVSGMMRRRQRRHQTGDR